MGINLIEIKNRLISNNIVDVYQAVKDIRNGVEIFHTAEFSSFLSLVYVPLRDLIGGKIPVQTTDNDPNRCRKSILEIFYRFPNSDVLKPYTSDIAHVALLTFQDDNEDNALIALRILFDVHKIYRPLPENSVQPFLDKVLVLYRNAPNELDKLFTQPNSMQQNERSADDAAGSSVSMDQPKEQGVVAKPVAGPAVLVKGMQSFKVLTECPLVIMLLFQIYPFKFMEKNGPILLPAMLHVLMLNPPLFFASSPDSSENAASISLKLHDFFAAQVKTLSFITYLLRGSVDIIRQYCGPSNASVGSSGLRGGNIVASSVVNLLSKCPSESVVTRKELLLGIRHVLATDFRRELVEYIPKFVDEGFLLGFYNSSESKVHDPMSDVASLGSKATSHYGVPLMRRTSIGTTASTANVNDNVGPLDPAVTAAPTSAVASVILAANKYATLRPLTCSVYIDIVHYAKDSLSASQLVVIMETLCNHTHEESSVLPLNIQIACLKTISDLVEVMYNNQDFTLEFRENMYMKVHWVLVKKLEAVGIAFKKLGALSRKTTADAIDIITTGSTIVRETLEKSNSSKKSDADKLDKINKELETLLCGPSSSHFTVNPIDNNATPNSSGASGSSTSTAAAIGFNSVHQHAASNKNIILLDEIREMKTLMKTILYSCKVVTYYLSDVLNALEKQRINNQGQVENSGGQSVAAHSASLSEFMKWCGKQLLLGMGCVGELIKFGEGNQPAPVKTSRVSPPSIDAEIIDIMDKVADSFLFVDICVFRAVLASNMYSIFSKISEYDAYLTMVQFWLSVKRISGTTIDCLLAFLMQHLPALSYLTTELVVGGGFNNHFDTMNAPVASPDERKQLFTRYRCSLNVAERVEHKQQATVLIKLFRIVLKGLSQKNSDNDKVLQPYLSSLIQQCLRFALECRANSNNYYIILRSLFRTITVGNFELLYKEIVPLLPIMLKTFVTLLRRTENKSVKNLLLELCLTIPARLQSLLPYIPSLFEILVEALQTDNDLPSLALRTLEFWIENLNHNYMQSAMLSKQSLMTNLMAGISLHLRPYPYPYGMLAVRVFGKLGGRNKIFMREYFLNNPRSLNSLGSMLKSSLENDVCTGLSVDDSEAMQECIDSTTNEDSIAPAEDIKRSSSDGFFRLQRCAQQNVDHLSDSLPLSINIDGAVLAACKLLMSNYGHISSDIELLCNVEFYVTEDELQQHDLSKNGTALTKVVKEEDSIHVCLPLQSKNDHSKHLARLFDVAARNKLVAPHGWQVAMSCLDSDVELSSTTTGHTETTSGWNSYLDLLSDYKYEVHYLYSNASSNSRESSFNTVVTALNAVLYEMYSKTGVVAEQMVAEGSTLAETDLCESRIELDPTLLFQHKTPLMHSLLVAISISYSDALLKNAVDLYMEHTWSLFCKLCFVEYANSASKSGSNEKRQEQTRIFSVVHSVILTLLTDLRPQVNRASVKLLKFWFNESIKLRNSTSDGDFTFSLIISGFLRQWVEYCACNSELQVGRVGNVTVRMAGVRVLQEFFSIVPFEYLLMDDVESVMEVLFELLKFPRGGSESSPWAMVEDIFELIHVLCIKIIPIVQKGGSSNDTMSSVCTVTSVANDFISLKVNGISSSCETESKVTGVDATAAIMEIDKKNTEGDVESTVVESDKAPMNVVYYQNGENRPPVRILVLLLNHMCHSSMLIRKSVMIGLRGLELAYSLRDTHALLVDLSPVLSAMVFSHLDGFYQASLSHPMVTSNASENDSTQTPQIQPSTQPSRLIKAYIGGLSALTFCLTASYQNSLISVDEKVLKILNYMISETDSVPSELFTVDSLGGIRSQWHLDIIIPSCVQSSSDLKSPSGGEANSPAEPDAQISAENSSATDESVQPAEAKQATEGQNDPVYASASGTSSSSNGGFVQSSPYHHYQQYHHHRRLQQQFQNYEASDVNLYVSSLCNGIPWLVEARLMVIRFIRAVFVHESYELLKEDWTDLRYKCFSILFRSLAIQWDEIIVETQITLNNSISKLAKQRTNHHASFPKDIMHECLRPLTKDVQDIRRLTVPTLRALEAVLNLVTNKQHMSLANLFLSFLKSYCDPSPTDSEGSQSGQTLSRTNPMFLVGQEQSIVVALMNVFHLLPWHTLPNPNNPVLPDQASQKVRDISLQQFTGDFVEIVLQIESVRFRYPHVVSNAGSTYFSVAFSPSPGPSVLAPVNPREIINMNEIPPKNSYLLLPLAKFLGKNPKEAVLYFLDGKNICRKPVMDLLLRLISCKDDIIMHYMKPVYLLLIEKNPCKILIKSAFQPFFNSIRSIEKLTSSPCAMLPPNIPKGPETTCAQQDALYHGICLIHELTMIPEVVKDRKTSLFYNNNIFGTGVSDKPTPAPMLFNSLKIIWRAVVNNLVQLGPQSESKKNPLSFTVTYDFFEALERIKTLMLCLLQFYKNERADFSAAVLFDIIHIMTYDFSGYGGRSNEGNKDAPSSSDTNDVGGSYSMSHFSTKMIEHFRSYVPDLLQDFIAEMVAESTSLDHSVAYCAQCKINSILKTYFLLLSNYGNTIPSQDVDSDESRKKLHYYDMACAYSYEFKTICMQVLIIPLIHQLVKQRIAVYAEPKGDPAPSDGQVLSHYESYYIDSEILRLIVVNTLSGQLGHCESVSLSKTAAPANSGEEDSVGFGNELNPPLGNSGGFSNSNTGALRIELLKLTTILIQHNSLQLVKFRKELIKFAWNHLKSDEMMIRHTAYISMCAFITAYETPPKIILQVYVALLRAYLHEYNEMMKLALDMLLTALPSRLRSDDFAKAMKWSKKIMLDELYSSGAHASSSGKRRGGSGSMSAYADANSSTANVYKQLQLWQIVMRHPVVFYNYRSYFVAQMINTITILGGIMYPSQQQRTASSSIEEEQRRQVALGIADLLVGWELYRSHKSKQATGDGATKEKEDGTANLQKADEVGKSELVEVRSAKRVRLNHDGDSLGVTWASNVPPTETSADALLSEANVPKTSASALEEFTLQPNMIQLLGNFVIKLGLLEAGVGSSSGASKSSGSDNGVSNGESLSGIISAQCLNIFRHLVSLLPMKNIRLSQFDKVLRSLLDSYAAYYRSKLNAVAAASGGKSVQAPPISHQPSSRSLKLVLEYLCASIDCCTHNPDLLLHSSNVSIITELLPYVLVNKSALVVTELRHVLSKMASLCPLKCPRTIGERTSFTNAAAQDSESNNKAMIRDYYYPRMNLLLDNMIIKAADKVTAMYRSQQSNDANSAHNSKVYPATPQQFLDSCPAWHILLILDDLTGGAGNAKGGAPKMGSDPSWGIMHGSALMKLAQSLLHYHYDSINIQLRSGPMQIVTSLAEHGQYVVHTKTEEEMYPTYDIRVLFDEVVNGHVSKQSTVHSAPAKVSDGFLAPVASTATPVTPWSNSASIADSISLDANTVSLCLCLVILGRITIQSIDAQNSGPPNNAMELHIDAVVHMLLSTLEHSDHPFVVYISCSLLQKMRLIEKQGSKDKRSESLLVILNRMDERIIVNNIKSLGRFRNELLAVPVYVRSIILYESLCSTLNMREATSSALVPLAGLQCYSYPVLKRYIQKKYGISSGETNSVDKFSETVIRVIKSGSNDCTTSKSRYWPVLLSTLLLQYGFKNENENCNLFVSNMEQLCLVDLSVSDNIWQQYIEWCWKRIVGSCDHTKKSTLMPDDESCRKWLNLCSSIYENVSRGEYIQKLTVFNEDRNLYVCCGNDATTTACNSNSCIVGSNLVMSMYNKLLYNLPWRFNPPAPTSVAEGLLRPFFHKLLGMRQSSSDMHFKHVEVAGDRYGMLADGCWFPPEFIAAVGSRFRMHAVTNSVLECMIHANAHAVDPKCAGGEEEISNSTLLKPVNAWTSVLQYNSTKAVNLLLSSYEELHDDDMTLALNRLMIAQDSKPSFCHGINMNTVLENAIHLESLGKYEYAQKFLHLYMILVERQEQYVSSDPSSLSGEASLLNYEICGKRWMKCAKQLTQWNVLYDHSKSTNVPDMEAAAMMEDWDLVKKYRCFPSTVALLEQGSTSTKLYDGMLAVMNSKFPDADRACAQAVQMSLMEWENLPSALHAGSNAHKSLLHTFHRIIEIRESAGMVIQAKENAEKELKGMIKLWRSRLPDGNDKYYVWDNVLKWRLHVYNAIGNMLATYRSSDTEDPEKKQEEEAAMASLHDIPNATVRLTKAARHHKLYPTSLSTISKLDTVTTMDIDNAFAKVREHMACYLYVNTTTSVKLTVPPSAAPVAGSSYIMPPSMREQANYIRQQRQCGLNMITNTNVSYFGNTQQAEVYRLRGVFHVQLGSLNDAQKAYAESVQTSPTYSKTWLSWGVLCDYIASSQSTDSMSDASQLNLYSTVMIAILKAICYNGHSTSNASSQQVDICHSDGSTVSITSPAPVSTTITNTSQTKALTLLPHLIWLCIKFADSKVSDPEHLCKLLVSHSSSLPAWIWMPYVDVLMNVVAHSVAGSHIMKILERVCIAYPQVILPTLMGNSLKNTMQKYSMMPQFFHMGSPLHQKSARCESLIQNFIAKKIPTYYYKYSLFSSTMINSFEVTPVMQLYALLHRMITYNFVDNTDFTIGDDKLASECVPAHVIPDLVDGMVDLLYVGIGTGERSNGQPSYRLRNPFAGTTDIASEHESIGINTEDLSKNSLSSPAKKGAGRGAGKGKPAKKQRDAIAKEDAVTTLDSVESDFFSPSMSSTQLFGDLLSEYGISEVVSVATASTPTRKSGKLAVESDKLKPVLDGSTVQYSVIANIKESMISHLKVLSSWKLLMLLRKWVLIACKYANDAECDGKNSNIQGCEVQRATEDMFTESYYYYKPNKSLDGEHGSSSRSGNSIILDLSLDKNINIPGAYYHYHHQHSSSSNINSTGSPSSNNLMVESLSGSTTSTSSNSGSNATKLVKMLPCRMKSSLSSCFKNNQWHREVSFLGNDGHVYYYDVLMRDGSDRAPASHDSEMKWSSLCKYVDEIVIKSDKLSRGRDLCVPHSPILLLGTFQSVSDSGLVAFGAAMPRSSSLSLMCRGDSSSNNLNNSSNCQSMKEILEKYLIRNNFSSAMDKVVGEENVHFGTSVMLDYLIYVRLHCDHSMTNIPFMSLPNNILVGYVCERCSSFEKYVEFKKLIAYQMGMYAAINTLVASGCCGEDNGVMPNLDQIIFSVTNGKIFMLPPPFVDNIQNRPKNSASFSIFSLSSSDKQLLTVDSIKNQSMSCATSFRLTSNLLGLLSPGGIVATSGCGALILGGVCPGFNCVVEAMTNEYEIYSKSLLRLYLVESRRDVDTTDTSLVLSIECIEALIEKCWERYIAYSIQSTVTSSTSSDTEGLVNVNPDVVCVDRVYHSLLQKMEEIPLNSPLSTAACNTSSYNMPLDHNLQSLLGKISGSQYLKKQPLHNVAWY